MIVMMSGRLLWKTSRRRRIASRKVCKSPLTRNHEKGVRAGEKATDASSDIRRLLFMRSPVDSYER